jgi:hypothetical protein
MALNKTPGKLPQASPGIQPLSKSLRKFSSSAASLKGINKEAQRKLPAIIKYRLGIFTYERQIVGQSGDAAR